MTEKIVQTAGRNTLGEFAPEFAHFNDDILFGENCRTEWFEPPDDELYAQLDRNITPGRKRNRV